MKRLLACLIFPIFMAGGCSISAGENQFGRVGNTQISPLLENSGLLSTLAALEKGRLQCKKDGKKIQFYGYYTATPGEELWIADKVDNSIYGDQNGIATETEANLYSRDLYKILCKE